MRFGEKYNIVKQRAAGAEKSGSGRNLGDFAYLLISLQLHYPPVCWGGGVIFRTGALSPIFVETWRLKLAAGRRPENFRYLNPIL